MLSFLLMYFLTCLLTDLSIYFFQNRPIPFPGRKTEVTRPGFRFFGSFYVVVNVVMDACLLLLCFRFFSTKPRDWLEMTYFVSGGT